MQDVYEVHQQIRRCDNTQSSEYGGEGVTNDVKWVKIGKMYRQSVMEKKQNKEISTENIYCTA